MLPEGFRRVVLAISGGTASSFNHFAKGLKCFVIIFCSLVIAAFCQQKALVPLGFLAHAVRVPFSCFAAFFNALKSKQCQRILTVDQ